jgi:hypothetical protein
MYTQQNTAGFNRGQQLGPVPHKTGHAAIVIIPQCHVCKNVKFTNKKTKTLDILVESPIG